MSPSEIWRTAKERCEQREKQVQESVSLGLLSRSWRDRPFRFRSPDRGGRRVFRHDRVQPQHFCQRRSKDRTG